MPVDLFQARDEGRQAFGRHFQIDAIYFYCCATFHVPLFLMPTYLFLLVLFHHPIPIPIYLLSKPIETSLIQPTALQKSRWRGKTRNTYAHALTHALTHTPKNTTWSCIFGLGGR